MEWMPVRPDGLTENFRQYVVFVVNIMMREQLRKNVNNEREISIISTPTTEPEFPLPCSQNLVFSPFHVSNEFSPYTYFTTHIVRF
jgi:hypothetical protein